ncbi:MAG TPA: response regulator [Flavitalea sp.]|nr:response regulator [Flavitalea sp.]
MVQITEAPVGTYFLYADDDPDDQEFFKQMVAEINSEIKVVLVDNGLELLQYLNNVVSKGNLPCCIVLDINMPIWDGIRTLKALKVEEKYKRIPVIMFTTSRSLRDNELSLMLGAQGFITKPVNHKDFSQLYHKFAEVCREG